MVVRLIAKTVLAELAVRRGDPDASERLAEVGAEADRTGEPQRIVPVLELEIEWALTTGAPMPTARLERLIGQIRPRGNLGSRYAMRVAAWAAVAGIEVASTRRCRRLMPPWPGATGALPRTRSATSAGFMTGR